MEPDLAFSSIELSTKYHVTTAIFGVLAAPTFTANILLLLIVFRSTKFRDLSTMLVAMISIADALYVAYTCIYIAIQYLSDDVSDTVATVLITIQSILRMIPTLTCVIVAYNWYIAKFKPMLCYRLHQLTNVSLKCYIGTRVGSVLACSGVPFVVGNRFKKIPYLVYSLLLFLLHLIALVSEVFMYVKNIQKTKKERQQFAKKKLLLSFNIKITKVFLFSSVAYFSSNAPLLLYPFLDLYLNLPSKHFAIFLYHLISCIPCFLNPICLYLISQKIQDELRDIFGMSKTSGKRHQERKPETPEAFSANKGFFEPRTPTWRQVDEYWKREIIYGEYPSVSQHPEQTKKDRKQKKDVRFNDVVEEVCANIEETASGQQQEESCHERKEAGLPTQNVIRNYQQHQQTDVKRQPKVNSNQSVDNLDLGLKTITRSGGSWPRSQTSPYNKLKDLDLTSLGHTSLLQQNKHFKRSILSRSRSLYFPRRESSKELPGNSDDQVQRSLSLIQTSKTRGDLPEIQVKETHL